MASQRTQRIAAFWLSVVGHALIVVALTFSVSLSGPEQTLGTVIPIETVMVDQAALDARAAEIEAARQAEIQRQQRVEQERQRQADQERREREAAEREKLRIQQQQAAEAEREAQLERERIRREAEDAERQRQEQIAREREEAERRRREEEAARQRQQIAAEIAAAAAAEEQARAAVESGARAQWAAMISNKVQQNWQRPPNATQGLECLLIVQQVITGDVRSVTVSECNVSDANIIRSLENAVQASSPLPRRPPGVEFEPTVRIRFKPTN